MSIKDNPYWLLLQNSIADALYNWSNARSYPAVAASHPPSVSTTTPTSNTTAATWDEYELDSTTANLYPQQEITLYQYRPAWEEQLALMIAGLPFCVVNVAYATQEATGPLPCFMDLTIDKPAILIGRNSSSKNQASTIHEYLIQERNIDLNQGLSSEQQIQSFLFEHLLRTTLHASIQVLRYQDDHTWQHIYKKQCLAAAASGNGHWLFASVQAWSERVVARFQMSKRAAVVSSVEQAVEQARTVFDVFEKVLDGKKFVLDTDRPTFVDVVLWSSLADALLDMHLIVVLADFPCLCEYAQRLWDLYWIHSSSSDTTATSTPWQEWNRRENFDNAFNKLPMIPSTTITSEWKHAVELMEQLSLRDHKLHEQLTLIKSERRERDKWARQKTTKVRPNTMPIKKEPRTSEESTKELHVANDQYWLAMGAFCFSSTVLYGYISKR
jgi:hypothetical protein